MIRYRDRVASACRTCRSIVPNHNGQYMQLILSGSYIGVRYYTLISTSSTRGALYSWRNSGIHAGYYLSSDEARDSPEARSDIIHHGTYWTTLTSHRIFPTLSRRFDALSCLLGQTIRFRTGIHALWLVRLVRLMLNTTAAVVVVDWWGVSSTTIAIHQHKHKTGDASHQHHSYGGPCHTEELLAIFGGDIRRTTVRVD